MKTALLLATVLSVRAHAAPDPAALMRSALPPGFAPVAAFGEPAAVAVPVPVLMSVRFAQDTQSVALAPLLDRHLTTTDSFAGAGGTNLISGTLDLKGDGYLAVTPPGSTARFFKIARGMSGGWSDGAATYRVGLSISIFRPRLSNYIQIKDAASGRVVWEKRIIDLFRVTYRAGEPVSLAGRPYRLFYSQSPDLGVSFIYDDTSGGGHDYKFYMVPLEQIIGASPVSYRMFNDEIVKLRVSADRSTLEISR